MELRYRDSEHFETLGGVYLGFYGRHVFDFDFERFRLNSQGKGPVSIADVEGASPN